MSDESDLLNQIMADYVSEIMEIAWFENANETPEDMTSDTAAGIQTAIIFFMGEEECEVRDEMSKRLLNAIQDSSVSNNHPGPNEVLNLFSQKYEDQIRKKIRKSIPMSLHRQAVNDAFFHNLKYGLIETLFSDVAPNLFFRTWYDWLKRGHFACSWDGDLNDSHYDHYFVLLNGV
ncbi:hypothetical protein CA11_09660 [Gimesia maris]|uniref:hypothetical protein n=1 Tax=Gimesia maris TaxID=122 RepID=UPI00118B6ECF|nr:hypothetical protein [Gimesia maris]QDU13184.1 hypothetical protein CA11_09660 [Gimesia maris]